MRTLREIQPDSAVIQVRNPGAAAVLTLPLLLVAAALPWWVGAAPSHGWIYPTALACVAGVAFVFARPRRVRVRLDPGSILRLDAADYPDDPTYRVFVVRGEQETLLLEHPRVQRVLADLGRLLDVASLELEDSAGVDADYLRSTKPRPAAELRPTTIASKLTRAEIHAVRAIWGGAAFIALVFGWSLANAQSPISPLSFVLPVISWLLPALVGAGLWTERLHVEVTPQGIHVVQLGLFGRRKLFDVRAESVSGASVLGSTGPSAVRHVVLATTSGPRVLALDPEGARRLVGSIGPISTPVPLQALGSSGVIGSHTPPSLREEGRRRAREEVVRARQS